MHVRIVLLCMNMVIITSERIASEYVIQHLYEYCTNSSVPEL